MNSLISFEKKPPLPFLLTPLQYLCLNAGTPLPFQFIIPLTLLHLQLLNVKKTTMMMLMEVPKVIPPFLKRGCDTMFFDIKRCCLPDLCSCRTFGLAGPLVSPDLWSRWTFGLGGPLDIAELLLPFSSWKKVPQLLLGYNLRSRILPVFLSIFLLIN